MRMADPVSLTDGLFRGLIVAAVPAAVAWAAIVAIVSRLV